MYETTAVLYAIMPLCKLRRREAERASQARKYLQADRVHGVYVSRDDIYACPEGGREVL